MPPQNGTLRGQGWEAYMDTLHLKMRNYTETHDIRCVLLGEYRLRHNWATYASQNNSTENVGEMGTAHDLFAMASILF